MMRLRQTTLGLAVILAGVLLLTGCPSRTTISKIKGDPSRYQNKTVGIAGTVRDSYGVLNFGGAYEIADETGSIWVVSRNRAVPSRGAQVGVEGKVYSGLTFGGRNFAGPVIEETDRRVK